MDDETKNLDIDELNNTESNDREDVSDDILMEQASTEEAGEVLEELKDEAEYAEEYQGKDEEAEAYETEETPEPGENAESVELDSETEEVIENAMADETLGTESEEDAEQSADEAEEPEADGVEEKLAEEKKPKKENKLLAFVKKHLTVFILAGLGLLAILGGLIAYFVVTKDMVFISKPEQLLEAVAEGEGEILVFRKDVVVDNLTINKPYTFSLKGHTLTVTGELKFELGDSEGEILIGTKKKKEYIKGGKVTAAALTVNAPKARLKAVSDIIAGAADIEAFSVFLNEFFTDYAEFSVENLEFSGKIYPISVGAAEVKILAAASAIVKSEAKANFDLGAAVSMTLSGSALSITNGKNIVLENGAFAGAISFSQLVVIAPDAAAGALTDIVKDVIFQQKLDAPKTITVIKEGDKLEITVTKVKNATRYFYTINGAEHISDGAAPEKFELSDLAPGTYTIRVKAQNTTEQEGFLLYCDSEFTEKTFDYAVKLAAPVVVATEGTGGDAGKVFLYVDHVRSADFFDVYINGEKLGSFNKNPVESEKTRIDITDKVAAAGNYSIVVTSHSNKSYFESSDEAQCTYNKTVALGAVDQIAVEENAGVLAVSWQAVPNAKYYKVEITKAAGSLFVGEIESTTYTTALEMTFALPEGATSADVEVTVTAVPYGYYGSAD
ncbi:MAG: hypothetical protein ACOYIN_04440 [Christensenellales bacterium]|jgi:hypothetical protein